MGTKVSIGTGRSHSGRSEEGIHRVDYEYLAMERRGIEEEIREHHKTLARLRGYEKSLIEWHRDHQDEDAHDMIERIVIQRKRIRDRLGKLNGIHEYYVSAMELERFAEGDWIQFLLLGNKLSPSDILNEWTKEAEKVWKERGGKKIHPGTKITESIIQEILALYDSGMKRKDIATRLGISTYPVNKYIKERSNE